MATQPALQIDSPVREQIEQLALAARSTPQAIIEKAIAEYADRLEKRRHFHQDALDAMADYEATGLHLTGEEVDQWLARIEAGENPPLPPCHT